MKNMIKRLRNERGLTLVELLAVIVILAIVAVIAFVMIGRVIDNARVDAHIANAQQLISSAKLYEAQGGQIATGAGGVTYTDLKKEGMIDTLTDPWKKQEYTNESEIKVTIEKDGDEEKYKAYIKDDATKYEIKHFEDVLNQGRDEVFKD